MRSSLRRLIGIAAAVAALGGNTISPSVTRAVDRHALRHRPDRSRLLMVSSTNGARRRPSSTTQTTVPAETTTQESTSSGSIRSHRTSTSRPRYPFGQVNAVERTTLQAARESRPGHRVVAATNGDFWRNEDGVRVAGQPQHSQRRAGVRPAGEHQGALGFMADGTPIIGRPVIEMSITLAGCDGRYRSGASTKSAMPMT